MYPPSHTLHRIFSLPPPYLQRNPLSSSQTHRRRQITPTHQLRQQRGILQPPRAPPTRPYLSEWLSPIHVAPRLPPSDLPWRHGEVTAAPSDDVTCPSSRPKNEVIRCLAQAGTDAGLFLHFWSSSLTQHSLGLRYGWFTQVRERIFFPLNSFRFQFRPFFLSLVPTKCTRCFVRKWSASLTDFLEGLASLSIS